jgi:hypothetical protein
MSGLGRIDVPRIDWARHGKVVASWEDPDPGRAAVDRSRPNLATGSAAKDPCRSSQVRRIRQTTVRRRRFGEPDAHRVVEATRVVAPHSTRLCAAIVLHRPELVPYPGDRMRHLRPPPAKVPGPCPLRQPRPHSVATIARSIGVCGSFPRKALSLALSSRRGSRQR